MADLGRINPLDERLQAALHSIALQYGGRPPQQEAAGATQDAPQVADPYAGAMPPQSAYTALAGGQTPPPQTLSDPYAGTPAPRPSSPGAPSASYRMPNQPWTQVPLDQSGQPMGTPGNRPPMTEAQQQPPMPAAQAAAPQAQQQQQFGPIPQQPSAQQAMNYLHSLGYDTSNPDVARLVPRAQEALYKQAMDQYKSNLSIANTQSEITARGATEQRQANPPLNESQSNAALYADRMRVANQIISDPKIGAAGTDLKQANLAKVPIAGNYMVSDEMQQLTQAQRDFINADLRKESGAVISPSEFENARLQYFPQPGDGPKVLAQKAKNRETALAGIERAAGPTYAKGQKQPVAEAPGKIRTYNPTSGKLE